MKGEIYIGTAPEITFVGIGDFRDFPLQIDPALPGSERTVYSEWSKGACITLTMEVPEDVQIALTEMFILGRRPGKPQMAESWKLQMLRQVYGNTSSRATPKSPQLRHGPVRNRWGQLK